MLDTRSVEILRIANAAARENLPISTSDIESVASDKYISQSLLCDLAKTEYLEEFTFFGGGLDVSGNPVMQGTGNYKITVAGKGYLEKVDKDAKIETTLKKEKMWGYIRDGISIMVGITALLWQILDAILK